jgi:hypothetical protein
MLHNYRHELSRLSWLFNGGLHPPPPLKAMYLKNRSQGNCENILTKVKRWRLIVPCLFNYKIGGGGGQSLIYCPTPILLGQWPNEFIYWKFKITSISTKIWETNKPRYSYFKRWSIHISFRNGRDNSACCKEVKKKRRLKRLNLEIKLTISAIRNDLTKNVD